jgi:hypothetical protein
MIYVRIERMNGRGDHVKIGEWINQSGTGLVYYNAGGWCDRGLGHIAPHLKFENDEDAIAYVLANGGEISKTIPETIPRWGVVDGEENEG